MGFYNIVQKIPLLDNDNFLFINGEEYIFTRVSRLDRNVG